MECDCACHQKYPVTSSYYQNARNLSKNLELFQLQLLKNLVAKDQVAYHLHSATRSCHLMRLVRLLGKSLNVNEALLFLFILFSHHISVATLCSVKCLRLYCAVLNVSDFTVQCEMSQTLLACSCIFQLFIPYFIISKTLQLFI